MEIQPGEQIKGRGLTISIDDDTVVIQYGVLNYGFLGAKRVPVSSITALNWKEPGGWTVGFLELAILGENIPRHAAPNVRNQNRLMFEKESLSKFSALRDWIQVRMGRTGSPAANRVAAPSPADEIAKLATLLKDGYLTQDEFDAQKAKLLG